MKIWTKIKTYPKLGLVLLAYAAFISLGMPDGLLGVAWPSIRTGFSIPLDAVGMLLTASIAGYMTSSFSNGPLIARWGIGRILAASCTLTGLALIGYTLVPVWWMMVAIGVFAGLGAGAIDAGLNTYVAANFGEGLMQWLHASYGIGVTLGPIIMTIALAATNSWRVGYRIVGVFQILLATSFLSTMGMWNKKEHKTSEGDQKKLTDYKTPMGETLRNPKSWLSALLFLLYCGIEVSFGTWTYSLLTESRGIEPSMAGLVAGSYWATFTIGRILAGLYAKRVGVRVLVQASLVSALIGTILLIWNPSAVVNVVAVGLIGLAIAPVFPALMSGTSARVGDHHAANTIGMQMAFTGLGTVLIPSLVGVLARRFTLEIIPICLVVVLLTLFAVYRLSLSKNNNVEERSQ